MPDDYEQIPKSQEAEEAVLGSILIDGECINEVIDTLSPKDFFYEQNQWLYESMVNLKERGEGVNQITITQELHRRGKLDECGGAARLSYLLSICPTSLDITHYADVVRRCSFYRQMIVVSGLIAQIAIKEQPSDIISALDKCDGIIQKLRSGITTESRRLILDMPRLIETNPPRYIWNVNGKDLRLTLSQITQWGKFKNVVISELNFVPIKPRDWDGTINAMITHSLSREAPVDASEEQQLKIAIQRWFERMREASVYSDLSVGRHIIKEVYGTTYYFFKSTPLLDYLKKEYKRGFSSEDLWVFLDKWRGRKHKIRVKHPTSGSMPVDLWGIPLGFTEETEKEKVDKLQQGETKPPDWF